VKFTLLKISVEYDGRRKVHCLELAAWLSKCRMNVALLRISAVFRCRVTGETVDLQACQAKVINSSSSLVQANCEVGENPGEIDEVHFLATFGHQSIDYF
jgi:hypothetical protein